MNSTAAKPASDKGKGLGRGNPCDLLTPGLASLVPHHENKLSGGRPCYSGEVLQGRGEVQVISRYLVFVVAALSQAGLAQPRQQTPGAEPGKTILLWQTG